MKARDMNAALYRHFIARYAVLTEVTTTETAPTGDRPYPVDRRCDVLLYTPKERIAVEVKVDRGDLRADVADPTKQAAWVALTHRQAYAVPEALVDLALEIVPARFGVLAVGEPRGHVPGAVRWARRAPKHYAYVGSAGLRREVEPGPLPPRILYTLLIRCANAEARTKGHGWDAAEDDVETLRAQVERLRRDLELAERARDRANARTQDWQAAFAVGNPVPCRTCRAPLRPRMRRYAGSGWVHTPDDEAACQPVRAAAAEEEHRKASWWREGMTVHVPGPEPIDTLDATPPGV